MKELPADLAEQYLEVDALVTAAAFLLGILSVPGYAVYLAWN